MIPVDGKLRCARILSVSPTTSRSVSSCDDGIATVVRLVRGSWPWPLFSFEPALRIRLFDSGRGSSSGSSSEKQSENDSSVVDVKLEQLDLTPRGDDFTQGRDQQGRDPVRFPLLHDVFTTKVEHVCKQQEIVSRESFTEDEPYDDDDDISYDPNLGEPHTQMGE